MTPTVEQEAILAGVRDSRTPIIVIAHPGTGKTTTLVLMANVMPPAANLLGLAFNVSAKKELEKRFPPTAQVMTINGLGHRAWGRAIGKRLILDEKKLGRLVTTTCKETGFHADGDQWAAIRWAVAQAMLCGLIPSHYPQFTGLVPDDEATWAAIGEGMAMSQPLLSIARKVLIESIREAFAGNISFDDQIYMSALFNGVFPRFANVMTDESQDFSPLNHIMLRKTLGPEGRPFVVGDPNQSIYAFRGADFESMAKIRAMRPDWLEYPLSVTFRCPRAVVERQHHIAPLYRAHESNPEGSFAVAPRGWDLDKLGLNSGHGVAVLCRNNAPLVTLAFKLIRGGHGCHMLGRDIGKGLKALAKKIIKPEDLPPAMALAIQTWRDQEFSIAQVKDDQAKMDRVTDQAESLNAILEGSGAKCGQSLFEEIEILFSKESGAVTLSTGHRAKGLEWNTVIHLDPWRLPSRFAVTEAQKRQEANLKHVIETRTRGALLEANAEEYAHA
jgi:DNA helicase-2/ATP-dependent DNA helicase PcrA